LYFSYCIRLSRPEEEFYNSSISKVSRILEIHSYGIQKREQVQQVYSMRDFLS
jgi:hypothetical protein